VQEDEKVCSLRYWVSDEAACCGSSVMNIPLFASAKTTRALTSSTHLILKPPLSFSKSRKIA
jgi:hypothetical protein